MKFLLKINTQEGDHEYRSVYAFDSKNEKFATQRVDRLLKEGWFDFGDGLTESECAGMHKISESDYKVLKRLRVV